MELGAYPVGIDIGDLSTERFEHHTLDLTKIDLMNYFQPESFDAVYMSIFSSSETLSAVLQEGGEGDNLVAMKVALIKRLQNDARKLLKPDGKLWISPVEPFWGSVE